MTLEENTVPQLWRKAEAEANSAVNLFLAPFENEREKSFEILRRLRNATAAMQALDRMLVNGPPKAG